MTKDIYVYIEHLRGRVADISYVTLAAARAITMKSGGSVVAVLLGDHVQTLANDLSANRVLYFDHPALAEYSPKASQDAMVDLIHDNMPRLVLFGDTSIGSDLAGTLSGRLSLPLVSNCRSFEVQGNILKFTSQICGGKIMVEGLIPEPSALVTMIPGSYKSEIGKSSKPPVVVWEKLIPWEDKSIQFRGFIEPDPCDVDIAKENVLIAVGRGIQTQDSIQLAQELANTINGVVTSSRPIVNLGWLPSTRLVGRSGKRVKPRLYMACGISGAPEHVEAMVESDVIIAINTDPEAPIYSLAKYGATIDLFDLLPALTENIRISKTANNIQGNG